ncbi:MAG: hypothetical protein GEV05_30450 [Betaproteobacteria bacterium]|nr:hypothetical protein [Betaproteobacteria bacterium]
MIALDAGIKDKDTLVRLQNHVEQLIDQEQRATGKALAREGKAEIMRKALDEKVLVDGWFRDTRVPLPLLSPEDLRNTIIPVDGHQFKLSSIPEKDFAAIVDAARRRGIIPTPQLIADKWFDLQANRKSRGASLGTSRSSVQQLVQPAEDVALAAAAKVSGALLHGVPIPGAMLWGVRQAASDVVSRVVEE